jgi:hypothetical protein
MNSEKEYTQKDFENCLIAIETASGTILAFDDDFRREVMAKVLEKLDQTEEEFIQSVENEEDLEYEDICACDYEELCDMLFISVKDGEISFEEYGDKDASELHLLLEDYLGYDFEFVGNNRGFEMEGVSFIRRK